MANETSIRRRTLPEGAQTGAETRSAQSTNARASSNAYSGSAGTANAG